MKWDQRFFIHSHAGKGNGMGVLEEARVTMFQELTSLEWAP